MPATMTKSNPARLKREADRRHLRQRVKETKAQSIQFIGSSEFDELEQSKHWRQLLKHPPTRRPSSSPSPVKKRRAAPSKGHWESLCDAPLLAPEEERELFRDMNYLKFHASAVQATLHERTPSLKKLERIEAALERSDEIRNEIITANTRLIFSIVKKFTDDPVLFEDLLSEGLTSLMNAVEKFNYDRGFRFSTYATMVVRRAVYRGLERSNRMGKRFVTGQAEVIASEEREHTVEEYSVDQVHELNAKLVHLMDELDERERFIVGARYGFVDLGIKATFSNLGQQLGVSKERVRQLELRAMDKLRKVIGDLGIFQELRRFAYRS